MFTDFIDTTDTEARELRFRIHDDGLELGAAQGAAVPEPFDIVFDGGNFTLSNCVYWRESGTVAIADIEGEVAADGTQYIAVRIDSEAGTGAAEVGSTLVGVTAASGDEEDEESTEYKVLLYAVNRVTDGGVVTVTILADYRAAPAEPVEPEPEPKPVPETDNRSIEVSSEEKLQLVRFDDSDVTDKGFAELVKISDDKLSAVSDAGNYEIVVRVKGESGGVIGYMPFGAGDGEGDKDAPADEASTCDQNDHPGDEDYSDDHGVGGGGFYRAYGYGEGDFEEYDADSDDAPDQDRHPAEGDCYTTAA